MAWMTKDEEEKGRGRAKAVMQACGDTAAWGQSEAKVLSRG